MNRTEHAAERTPSSARPTQAARYKGAIASGCLGHPKWQMPGFTHSPRSAVCFSLCSRSVTKVRQQQMPAVSQCIRYTQRPCLSHNHYSKHRPRFVLVSGRLSLLNAIGTKKRAPPPLLRPAPPSPRATHTHIHTHVRTHARMRARTHTHTNTHTTQTNTHTNTHTHTNTYNRNPETTKGLDSETTNR